MKKSSTSNCGPISLLPSFNKLEEKIIESQLQTHLLENILFTNDQFDFRKGKGIENDVHSVHSFR